MNEKKKTGPVPVNTQRDSNIRALRLEGRLSLQKIADQYGISRQRVHQILNGQ